MIDETLARCDLAMVVVVGSPADQIAPLDAGARIINRPARLVITTAAAPAAGWSGPQARWLTCSTGPVGRPPWLTELLIEVTPSTSARTHSANHLRKD